MNQPGNPYVTDAPLSPAQGFYGRQEILDWTVRNLHSPGAPPLVLFGQRTMGKTCLLRQLEWVLPVDAFLAVYFDPRDWTVNSLGSALAGLAGAIARRADLQPPGAHLFDDRGRFFLQTFFPRFRSVALRGGRRLVLLLDEFEVLDEAAEVALPGITAVKALYPFLLDLVGEGSPLALVVTVGRRVDDLALDPATAFNSTLVQGVGCLDWESAEALIRQAEANGTLRFSDLAVSHILSLTNCHPYWTQLLCQRVWERAYAQSPAEVVLIDTPAVEEAVPDALAAGDRALAWCWDGLGRSEKIYAAALAETAREGEALPVDRIVRTIAQRAAQLCTPEIELAPQYLAGRQVLKRSEEWGREGEYAFAAELFCLWVRQNRSLESVAGDLGCIDTSSERSFEIALEYFGRWEWDEAIRHFREALEANPSHARARCHLGEALLELGQIDEAVAELRQAHALDADEAELSLARALAAQRGAVGPATPGARGAPAAPLRGDGIPDEGAGPAPAGGVGAIRSDIARWLAQVSGALSGARIGDAFRLVFPVAAIPAFSAFVFYVIGVSLARGMSGVAWLPTMFDPSTFYRFGLISAAIGLFPGLRFSHEFIRHPVFNLELVYLSFSRYGFPFLAVVLVYVAFVLSALILETSVPEEEWEGFQIFFDWIKRLWE